MHREAALQNLDGRGGDGVHEQNHGVLRDSTSSSGQPVITRRQAE